MHERVGSPVVMRIPVSCTGNGLTIVPPSRSRGHGGPAACLDHGPSAIMSPCITTAGISNAISLSDGPDPDTPNRCPSGRQPDRFGLCRPRPRRGAGRHI
ncbi:hypothetical protein Ga0080574_TMP2727 [Salipiger abyssi]|uniref:Uncharacterized protein n=1 Tax=Salipiger abyssi TaxID=1250539 RepID=A0A1P8UUJ2_9RHOB|nr:hypothetical protein Ga0080574_TMP2727 [Salipiger abyssi]